MDGELDESPLAHIIGRVCEEFPCYGPAEALKAIEEDEYGLIFEVIEYRAYVRAYEVYKSTPMNERPKSAMMDRVSEIVFSLAKDRIAEQIE